MSRRFHKLGTFARLVVALCVVALTGGDVARDLHLLFAAHVVCVAHGELVEAEEASAGDADGASGPSSVIPDSRISDEHEHCWARAAAVRPPATRAGGPTAPGAIVARSETLLAFAAPLGCRALEVLDFAPKQGPPAS